MQEEGRKYMEINKGLKKLNFMPKIHAWFFQEESLYMNMLCSNKNR